MLNRVNPQSHSLCLAVMLRLSVVYLTVFAHHLWRTGPRPLALAMTAACFLLLYATADQVALALGWW